MSFLLADRPRHVLKDTPGTESVSDILPSPDRLHHNNHIHSSPPAQRTTPRLVPATILESVPYGNRMRTLTPNTQLLYVERDNLCVNMSTLSFRSSILSPLFPGFDLTFNDVSPDLCHCRDQQTFFIRLGKSAGHGGLWSVFDADLVALNVRPGTPWTDSLLSRIMHRVVVKVTRASSRIDEYAWCESSAQREATLYAGPLLRAGLVGVLVPTFYGMWEATLPSMGDSIIVAVYERVGDTLAERWSLLHPFWVPHIKDLYNRLHKAGVIHGDIQTCHVRRMLNGDGICLIDFDHGYELDSETLDRTGQEMKLLDHHLSRLDAESDDDSFSAGLDSSNQAQEGVFEE